MQEKRVGEILAEVREIDCLDPESSLAEAVGILTRQRKENGPGFVLVVRNTGSGREVIGTVTLCDVLARLESALATPESDIPIFWQGQFFDQVGQLLDDKVTKAMVAPEEALSKKSTLMEALHVMNSCGNQVLVVMDDNCVVGFLSREQLCLELINAAAAYGQDQRLPISPSG